MLRRLYYLFPDYERTKHVVDELLVNRVNIRNMHVIANDDSKTGNLPMASLFQRSDIRHSLVVGFLIGAVLGVIVAIIAHSVLNLPYGGFAIILPIVGALLGVWFSTMVGMMTPNRELKSFMSAIQRGEYLLILDIPHHSVHDIDKLIKSLHPEARAVGVEPSFPSFP